MANHRVPLRSIQRAMTMSDSACFKIAHVMVVRGQIQELLAHLPTALLLTFNKHPMMRFLQLKGEFAMGEVHPPIALDDIETRRLLEVTEVDAAKDAEWPAYVQHEVHTGLDRYTQFPFYLRVWVDRANDTARLFLFSDHHASDARSANTVLHDTLTFAAEISRATAATGESSQLPVVEPLPIQPSLYDLILNSQKLLSPVVRFVVKFAVRPLMKMQPKFTPLITPRADQADFTVPNVPNNPTTLLFAEGSEENLVKLLKRCREEGTTFFAALSAAITLSYAITANAMDDEAFKLFVMANFDMRGRVSPPIARESVGCFINADLLQGFATKGFNPSTKRFWDVAREIKSEVTNFTQNWPMLAIPQVFMDQRFHTETDPAFFEEFPIKYTQRADVNISSAGQYPYTFTHELRTGTLTVEKVHYNGHFPFLSMSSLFFVTSVKQATYGICHTYEDEVGKRLFDTAVRIMEHSWQIEKDDTLVDTFNRLFKDNETAAKQAAIA